MQERTSPVVWGNRADDPLFSWMSSYERDGYAVKRGLFTPDEINSALDSANDLLSQSHDSTVLENDGRTVRSIFNVHKLSPYVMNNLVRNPTILDTAKSILGSDVYVHQCHINYKNPHAGGEFFWHSDYTFWYWEDGMRAPRALSVFVFLDPQRIETGPLMVVPGSHMSFMHTSWTRKPAEAKMAVRHNKDDDAVANGLIDLAMLRQLTEHSRIETIIGEPGDVMFMDANLAHASGPNMGVQDRRVLLIIFNSVENCIGEPMSGGPPRPEYISSRDFTPISP
jgi:ectoine hydroxylase